MGPSTLRVRIYLALSRMHIYYLWFWGADLYVTRIVVHVLEGLGFDWLIGCPLYF